MKAIILAAGEGTRLKKYTKDLPKGMLYYNEKSLIEHQIDLLRSNGVDDIIVVRGFKEEKIDFEGITYFTNKIWNSTNMVESLMCAESVLNEDCIITYADIVYTDELLRSVLKSNNDFNIAIDVDWKNYWQIRYDKIDFDTESLKLDGDNNIISLGIADPPLEEIDGRYVGLMKFSHAGMEIIKDIYKEVKDKFWDVPWQQSQKPFRQAYMTDLIQELIDRKHIVSSVIVKGGWMEFDTNEDYEKQKDLTIV